MALLVDYRCPACGARQERWVASPPPGALVCAACGGEARRAFSPVGLGGRASVPGTAAPHAQHGRREPSMCQLYPQIPGICHMTPSAARRMVAAYTRDGRARDAEIARQATAAEGRAPTMSDAMSHFHQPPADTDGTRPTH